MKLYLYHNHQLLLKQILKKLMHDYQLVYLLVHHELIPIKKKYFMIEDKKKRNIQIIFEHVNFLLVHQERN